ncbi:MAG: hypothetical protein K2V38_18765 [Gemmataceae bacterium]|nr:hypothetical protein [Gemmataceae bacterium]
MARGNLTDLEPTRPAERRRLVREFDLADLGPRQVDLFCYLFEYLKAFGRPPSYAQMARSLGVTSPGSVTKLLRRLEARGKVIMGGRGGRGIAVVGFTPPPSVKMPALTDVCPLV